MLAEVLLETLIVSVDWHEPFEITEHFLMLTVWTRLNEVLDDALAFRTKLWLHKRVWSNYYKSSSLAIEAADGTTVAQRRRQEVLNSLQHVDRMATVLHQHQIP